MNKMQIRRVTKVNQRRLLAARRTVQAQYKAFCEASSALKAELMAAHGAVTPQPKETLQ